MKKPIIIGIAGKAHSGKDTVANMLMYQALVNDSTYLEWVKKHYFTNSLLRDDLVVHFADPLKRVISIIFNIDIDTINKNKDDKFYLYDKQEFVQAVVNNEYRIVTIKDLSTMNLNSYIAVYNGKIAFTFRTILQYIGTDLFKNKFSNEVWIKPTINEAFDIASKWGLCIIPDVRFHDEVEAIKNIGGKIIYIKRNTSINEINAEHSSEVIDLKYDYAIDNNGDLENLYNKIKEIYETKIVQSSTGD